MKVKCIDIKKLNKDGIYQSLTIGKKYIVLAIEFYDKSESTFSKFIGDFTIYRIKDNDGVVIPFPAKLFEIVSQKIPLIWILYQGGDCMYSILPKTWARSGFWEDYYNDEKSAIKDFEKVEREIISEE